MMHITRNRALPSAMIQVGQRMAIVDAEDVSFLSRYRWHVHIPKLYVVRYLGGCNGRSLYTSMHHQLMPPPRGFFIDHINGNPLDNRKANLRLATQADNARNHKVQRNNRSGVSGVSFIAALGQWKATINRDGEKVHLGVFASLEEATRVRREAEIAEYRNFSPLVCRPSIECSRAAPPPVGAHQ